MCGVIGIVGRSAVNQTLYDGLTVLQHRGQDAAGIVTYEDGRLFMRRSQGLVRDVFQTRHMIKLKGSMGIGHVRYPTAGVSSVAEAQPFYVNSPYGISLGHNGNLTNAEALKQELYESDLRHINTDSDTEVLLNVFAHELARFGKFRIEADDVARAVARVHARCRGGYAVVAMITGFGIVGFRDPNGIRPIVLGRRETEAGPEYLMASESAALDVLGFDLVRDVAPGECIIVTKEGQLTAHRSDVVAKTSPCIFEHVYLARPDSKIDGIAVQQARMRMGRKLADKIRREWPDADIDVVMPIPDTSRTAALELALALGLSYREGFVKNRYIPRTFIMPGQAMRRHSIRQKLNAIDQEFAGRRVLLVDDSIVRGNTSSRIVAMAREAGARAVFFASAAPPVRFPNVYGIDMPTREELISAHRSDAEVAEMIGADRLLFQDLADLVASVRDGNPAIEHFDVSCFNGEYVTGDVDAAYLDRLGATRSDRARAETGGSAGNDAERDLVVLS